MEDQQEIVRTAHDGVLALARTTQWQPKAQWQESGRYNRAVRVAVMQTINGALDESDEDGLWVPPAEGDASDKGDTAGNEQRGAAGRYFPWPHLAEDASLRSPATSARRSSGR